MQPSRKAIFALRALEHALGWASFPSTSKLATAEDFAKRTKIARDSAGLAGLLCGPEQARAVRLDGPGHWLSPYDSDTVEDSDGAQRFRLS